jgi:hypothetical protein
MVYARLYEDDFLIEEEEEEEESELTPEEREAERAALADVKDDEAREKLATELGLDPDEDSELLDKALAREKAHRERLSAAIKQKISWREKANTSSKKPDNKGGNAKTEIPDIEALVEKKLNERLEAQDLKALDLPDDLKAEVKDLAKTKGISIREAAQLPYINYRKEEMAREERLKQASPKRSSKSTYTSNIDPSKPLNPSDFDLKTEEGRKAWKEARDARDQYRASQGK